MINIISINAPEVIVEDQQKSLWAAARCCPEAFFIDVALRKRVLMLCAQDFLVEFANARLGDSFNEDDVIGEPPFGNLREQEFDDLVLLDLPGKFLFRNHVGHRTL